MAFEVVFLVYLLAERGGGGSGASALVPCWSAVYGPAIADSLLGMLRKGFSAYLCSSVRV